MLRISAGRSGGDTLHREKIGMITLEDLMSCSEEERKELQKGNLKKLVIGSWAPREAAIMRTLYNSFSKRKQFTRQLIAKILDRLFSIGMYTQVVTYDEVVRFIKSLPDSYRIARGPCACRINTAEELGPDARDLSSGRLDFFRQTPLNVDIQFGICGEEFGKQEGYEFITKRELLDLEAECRNMGLVSNIFVMLGGEGSICHCSSKTCVPLMAGRIVDGKTHFIKKGEYRAATDMGRCNQTGNCVKVCHFDARRLVREDGKLVMKYDDARCFGCGLCESVCPEKAIVMVRRKGRDENEVSII